MGCYPTWHFMKPIAEMATSIHNHRTTYLLPMRAFEVITPEANRPGSRLQPKRRGAAFVLKDSECIPGDPDGVVAKVNPLGFASRSFKRSVHISVSGVEFSRNYNALLSPSPLKPKNRLGRQPPRKWGWRTPLKKTAVRTNQKLKAPIACIHTVMESGFILITDRDMRCDCRAPFRDELTQFQGFLPAIRFHALKYKSGNRAGAMGCSPYARLDESSPAFDCENDPPSSRNTELPWRGDENPPARFALRRGKRRGLPIGSSRHPKRWSTGRCPR